MTMVETICTFCAWISLGRMILGICADSDLSIFNPIRNYKKWEEMNWFGVVITTLFLNIIFLPYAIAYWVYKLFTVGKKKHTF